MDLPPPIAEACAPLFAALPPDEAMSRLTGSDPKQTALVEEIAKNQAIAGKPELIAGLWLYVDDLDRSHTVSQSILTPSGSYWHGIMHRREGDFSNSHYWIDRAGNHPILKSSPELDPHDLIDAISRSSNDDAALVARQRLEWEALFTWCAKNS